MLLKVLSRQSREDVLVCLPSLVHRLSIMALCKAAQRSKSRWSLVLVARFSPGTRRWLTSCSASEEIMLCSSEHVDDVCKMQREFKGCERQRLGTYERGMVACRAS